MSVVEFFVKYVHFNYILLSGDKLVGEASRLVVAEACIQALDIEFTEGKVYEIASVKVIFWRLLH